VNLNGLKWAALLGCLASGSAWAQKIPVEDFAKRYELSDIELSPDGKHIAMAVPTADGLETQLQIVPLDGSGKVQVLRFARQQHVHSIVWSDDEQVVVSRAEREPLVEDPVSRGELMSSDIRGKNQEVLFAYVPDKGSISGRRKDQGFADIEFVLDKEPGSVLVSFTCWRSVCGEESPTTIYKVDTRTGNRKEVERSKDPAQFYFDATGRARVRMTRDKQDNPVLFYRPSQDSDWKPVPKELAGYNMSTFGFEKDNNTAYGLITDKGEPHKLYKLDLAAGTRTLLQGRDDVNVSDVLRAGYRGVPFGVTYDADKPGVRYFDNTSEWAKLHSGLLKAFPGQMINFNSFSRDNKVLLFTVWSDRNPGAYYVLNRDTNKVQLIAEAAPWFKPEMMAPVRPVEFTARDGAKLFGFYTAKAGATGPQPLIVMPHGGPFGPYDRWRFDRDAQFLASRGYAVLQVNFRGSGGRGYLFEWSGYKEWGGKLIDDVADGVKYAIDSKLADPKRICTFGASYGGYSALMSTVRYPDLYQCAIGYVGVYDLKVMYDKDILNDTKFGRRYLDRTLGNEDAKLIAMSPARNVDKIRVPVFLVQGRVDRLVPMEQFNSLEGAFRKQGTSVETMVASGEGHGFEKPENIAELYRRMEAFLDKNMPK